MVKCIHLLCASQIYYLRPHSCFYIHHRSGVPRDRHGLQQVHPKMNQKDAGIETMDDNEVPRLLQHHDTIIHDLTPLNLAGHALVV